MGEWSWGADSTTTLIVVVSFAKANKRNNAYYCLLLYSTLMDASELAEVIPIKFLHYQAIT